VPPAPASGRTVSSDHRLLTDDDHTCFVPFQSKGTTDTSVSPAAGYAQHQSYPPALAGTLPDAGHSPPDHSSYTWLHGPNTLCAEAV
jgi:hypothetical protein